MRVLVSPMWYNANTLDSARHRGTGDGRAVSGYLLVEIAPPALWRRVPVTSIPSLGASVVCERSTATRTRGGSPRLGRNRGSRLHRSRPKGQAY